MRQHERTWRSALHRGQLSLITLRLGQRFEAGDAVLNAGFALFVRAVELDAVVERDAAHLEGRLAAALSLGLRIEKSGAVVDARAAVGQLLAAFRDFHF